MMSAPSQNFEWKCTKRKLFAFNISKWEIEVETRYAIAYKATSLQGYNSLTNIQDIELFSLD